MPNQSLSLVIPIFNEEESIERTVLLALEVLPQISESYELILVDDASTDQTPRILESLKTRDPHIVIITHTQNQKLGRSLRDGFKAASKELIAYTDADLPINLYDLSRAMQVIETVNADVVAAYRHDRTSDAWYRILYTIVYNLLVRMFLGIRIRDVNFAFKVFKREALEEIEIKSEARLLMLKFLLA